MHTPVNFGLPFGQAVAGVELFFLALALAVSHHAAMAPAAAEVAATAKVFESMVPYRSVTFLDDDIRSRNYCAETY